MHGSSFNLLGTCQVAAITQSFQSLLMSQYFGHQGYEYVELGRFYQYFLLVGLLLWLLLMVNAVHPALRTPSFITKDARGNWVAVKELNLSHHQGIYV